TAGRRRAPDAWRPRRSGRSTEATPRPPRARPRPRFATGTPAGAWSPPAPPPVPAPPSPRELCPLDSASANPPDVGVDERPAPVLQRVAGAEVEAEQL